MMMHRDLVFERIYPFRPETVWAALTDPAALSEWLMETDFQPYVGHRFTFRTRPSPGFDGIVQCEVMAVDKPHRLAYTWQGGPIKKPTLVTWTLQPVADGTKVRLEHTGFEGLAGIAVSLILGSGWRGLMRDKLPGYIAQRGEEKLS
jgi:uncharacterized protein YndB with AHSA1/START domain